MTKRRREDRGLVGGKVTAKDGEKVVEWEKLFRQFELACFDMYHLGNVLPEHVSL